MELAKSRGRISLISFAFVRDFVFGYVVVFVATLVALLVVGAQLGLAIHLPVIFAVWFGYSRVASGYVSHGGFPLSVRQIWAGATVGSLIALIFQLMLLWAVDLHADNEPVLAVPIAIVIFLTMNLFWGIIYLPTIVKSELVRQNNEGAEDDRAS